MTKEEAQELGPLYALGALDEAVSDELKTHLDEFPDALRLEIASWQSVAGLLPLALELPDAPVRLKERILAGLVDPASQPHPSSNVVPFMPAEKLRRPWGAILSAAAAILLAVTAAVLYQQNVKLTADVTALTSELDAKQSELLAQRQQLDEVVARATRMVPLSGDAAAPQASARLFWDTDRQEWVIYFFNLPALPEDKDYQLWYITNDQRKLSARVFRASQTGRTELRVTLPRDLAPTLAATAVTVEPKGGSQQPTGPLFLKGAI